MTEPCESCGGDGFVETTADVIERCDACRIIATDERATEKFVEKTVLPLLVKHREELTAARKSSNGERAMHRVNARKIEDEIGERMNIVRRTLALHRQR